MTAAILLTLMSLASALIPYSETLTHIYVCGLVIGLGSGCWNGIANVWLIELWKNKSAPFLQLIQFMYGIGTVLSPLINQLFLGEDDTTDQTIAAPVLNSTTVNITSDTVSDKRESLKTPFLINGVIQITCKCKPCLSCDLSSDQSLSIGHMTGPYRGRQGWAAVAAASAPLNLVTVR